MIDQQIPSTLQSLTQAAAAEPVSKPAVPSPAGESVSPPAPESPPAPDESRGDAASAASPGDEPGPAPSGPPPPANPLPVRDRAAIDLESDEVEAEVLDDDAFFATLREAVHDDAPLGPRDDDRLSFFDHEDEADRGSFRDVFRRRR
jgi:hypothetical protein